jgi:glucose/arabinose dehydrogenase
MKLKIILLFLSILICSAQAHANPYITSGDVPAERGFKAVALTDDLEHPWGMAWLPNGDLLITERPGRLRLVRDGRLVPEPIQGIAPVFASGQGGLLDVSIHPGFENNRKVFFTYAHGRLCPSQRQ